jgi:pimeloyl-ACP methyl ester carboxylesterase
VVISNLEDVLRAYREGKIFGEVFGDGPVQVVWLHGWARSSADFAAAGALLADEGISSVALDLPGFGASPLPETPWGAAAYAALVAAAISEMGEGPLVVIGHSFGGKVATVVAASYPHVVKALVLTGAPLLRRGDARRSPRAYRVLRALHRRGVISESRMEAARRKYGSTDYRNAQGMLRDILVVSVNETFEKELAQVVAPVDLVWGANDRDVPTEVARAAQNLLTHSAEVVLDVIVDTGHLVPTERPASLVAHARRLASR